MDIETNQAAVATGKKGRTVRVLMEMRPAMDGFAGIPQENRLLFRGFRMLDGIDVEGMVQTPHRILAKGTSNKKGFFQARLSPGRRINRYSRVIISLAEKPFRTLIDKISDWAQKGFATAELTIGTLLGLKSIKLTKFESQYFEDFTWRTFFAKTLPASDFKLVATANQQICSVPWHTMHMVGLNTLNILSSPLYPRLNTESADVFIAQTPYPGRVNKSTKLVVRYHDALPVLMPQTIADKSLHQATHFYALMSNVKSGGYFSCVSEATRQDLIKLFPEAASKSVTIHNMVSHHYYLEDSSETLVPNIIRSRQYQKNEDEVKAYSLVPTFLTLREKENFYAKHIKVGVKYLLMVSTIEPRKNHTRLLAAWEVLKADVDPDLKLVIVGTLGWSFSQTAMGFSPWIDRGEVFMLNQVPAPDLRVLYKHAALTVCPSLGEGFDFAGVEAMRSGGVVTSSDIPVHREIYDDASDYFDPYSTMSLVNSIKSILYADNATEKREALRARGAQVSARYLPEVLLPKWDEFLKKITA